MEQRRCSCSLSVCNRVFVPPVTSSLVHFSHSDATWVCCQLSQPHWPPLGKRRMHSYLRFCLNHPQLFYLPLFAHAPSRCIQTSTAAQSRKKGIDLACIRKIIFFSMTNRARPGLYIRSGSASIPLLIPPSPANISHTIGRSTCAPCLFAVRHLDRVVNCEEDSRFHYILLRSHWGGF